MAREGQSSGSQWEAVVPTWGRPGVEVGGAEKRVNVMEGGQGRLLRTEWGRGRKSEREVWACASSEAKGTSGRSCSWVKAQFKGMSLNKPQMKFKVSLNVKIPVFKV